jgi:hypothetical protein
MELYILVAKIGRFKPFKRNLPEIAENSWAKFRGNLSNTVNLWDIGVNE